MSYSRSLLAVLAQPETIPNFDNPEQEADYAQELLTEWQRLDRGVNFRDLEALTDVLMSSQVMPGNRIGFVKDMLAGQKQTDKTALAEAHQVAKQELKAVTIALASHGQKLPWAGRLILHTGLAGCHGEDRSKSAVAAVTEDEQTFNTVAETARIWCVIWEDVQKMRMTPTEREKVLAGVLAGKIRAIKVPAGEYDISAVATSLASGGQGYQPVPTVPKKVARM